MKKILSLMLSLALLLSVLAVPALAEDNGTPADWKTADSLADDAAPGNNDDRAFEKFDHVVEVHIGCQIDPVDTTLAEGEDAENNQYTRYLLDNYNIKVYTIEVQKASVRTQGSSMIKKILRRRHESHV